MVQYVKLGNLEFVRKEDGVPTVDDPVGSYLFKKFQKGSSGKIEIGGMRKTYEQALEYFESGAMLRHEYETLLKRAKPSSLTQRREEIKASKIFRSELVRDIFGDVNKLPEREKRELINACQGMRSFKKFVQPRLEQMVQRIPNDFDIYRIKIMKTFQTRDLDELEFVFGQLKNVLSNNISFDYGDLLKYSSDKRLYEKYCTATHGTAFDLADIYREIQKKFGKR